MSEVSCPFCSTSQSLPHAAAGQTARCKSCGKTFMVPAAPSPSGILASAAVGPATVGRTPVPVPVPGGSRTPAPQEADTVGDAGRSSVGLILLGGAACFVVGGLLLVVVVLKLASRTRESDRPTAVSPGNSVSSQIVRWTPESSRASRSSSVASGVVIDLNSLAVDVRHVEFGEVRAKDAQNRVIVSDQRNYLQAYLKIKNLGVAPVKYLSWQGNSFASDGQQVQAALTDDQERSYSMQQFTHVAGIKGHTPQAIMAGREEVEDVVVFAIPDTIDRRTIRYFRLELPAEAYGGAGVYRFDIPQQSIEGFP